MNKPRYVPACVPGPVAPLPGWRLQKGGKPPEMSIPKQNVLGAPPAQEGAWLDEWGQQHTGKPPELPR